MAVGHKVIPLPLPRRLLNVVAWGESRLRGPRAKLTPDKVGYLCHPDFVSHAPVPAEVWTAQADTRAALAQTAEWYRANSLL